ncbi:uncharacterized protein LOC111614269 [Centruroides sculpturatus]|uniref:uncharacterized protein LOC111614269 n=1 Tax=Centruroides sculpturatus TaxID=218467 RepID=UPI000C6D4570|nr:uncharacterized protein LOC111614269 [Centruroides sculpturatus]
MGNSNISHKTNSSKEILLVYSKDKANNNSEVVRKLMNIKIKPSNMHIGIEKLRKVRGGGLAIELGTNRDVTVLEKTIEEQIPELVTRRPKKRWPHVAIYSVHNEITKKDLPKLIYQQNHIIYENLSEEEFIRQFRSKFVLGKKNATYINWIVETSPYVRKLLLNMEKVNVEWSRCRIVDFHPILQCFKCCGYHHSARDCSQSAYICSHCAGNHSFNECPNLENEPKCCNCLRNNIHNNQHNARDGFCPVKQRIKNFIVSRTEYGTE